MFSFQRSSSDRNYRPIALNSSGGFTTPTISSHSVDKTVPLSPPATTTSNSVQRPSNGSVFLPIDEDLSSRSSRSASYSFDRTTSSFDDPLSPVFPTEYFPFSKPTTRNLISNSSSSSSSSHPHSPAIVRTAPLYISVHSSTPPVPHIKQTVSSSAPPPMNDSDDPQSLFTRRSPSPQSPSILATAEQLNHSAKQSSASFQRQQYALSKNQQKQ